MTKNEIKAANKSRRDASAAQRGLDRKAHFEAGGDLASWRGRHTVFRDRKREASRGQEMTSDDLTACVEATVEEIG